MAVCCSPLMGLAALGLALSWAAPAGAAEPAPSSSKRPLVLLTARSGRPALSRMVSAIRAQLVDLPVRIVVHPVVRMPPGFSAQLGQARRVQRKTGALAVFWLDLADRERIYLYVAGKGGDRVVVRSLDGLDEAGRHEAFALILAQSARTLLSGGHVGIPPSRVRPLPAGPDERPRPGDVRPGPEDARPARKDAHLARVAARPGARPPDRRTRPASPEHPSAGRPRRAGAAPSRHGVGLELAYALEGVSSGVPVTHGAWGAVVWRIRAAGASWSAFAGYLLAPSIRSEGTRATLRISRHPVLLGARAHGHLGRLRLGGSLALTVDYVTHEVTSGVAYPDSDDDDVLVALTPAAHLEVVILPGRLRAFLSVGLHAYLNNRRYVVSGENVREVLLDPWPVRPRLVIGAAVDLY